MTAFEVFLVAGSVLLILSVLASKASGRLGIPALLVFLVVGMLAGSEGIIPILTGERGIYFDNAYHAQILGITALCYILFAGGLDTQMKSIRPVLLPGLMLATLGTLVTSLLTAVFVRSILHFSWLEGLLLGAIVSSTDAAAVFGILRSKGIHLKGAIKPILELESGSNDPIAVLMTIGLLRIATHESASLLHLFPFFVAQLLIGALMGVACGRGVSWVLNRIRLESEGLYPVLTIAVVILIYGLTQLLGGSGFIAVYLAGIVLGNENFIHKKSLVLFHDGIAWLMQIAMFLVLGLLVFPSRLFPVASAGLNISAFLIFIARPIAVFISLAGRRIPLREQAMISFIGLRGSVPIILSTYLLIARIDRADEIFHLVFFIVLTSILLQGTPIPWVAKILKVQAPARPKFRYPIEYVPTGAMKSELVEVEVPRGSRAAGRAIIDLALPKDSLIVLIQRRGSVIVPKGSTNLEIEDTMLVLAEAAALLQIKQILEPA